MDDSPFRKLLGAIDTLVVWDYTSLDETLPLPTDKPIHLLAWSMGVWAATQVLTKIPLASATAINGTPTPISDTHGIPVAIFEGTLVTFSEVGLLKFRRRMCGGGEALKAFMEVAPQRSLDDLRLELATLFQTVSERPSQPLTWTRAIVGMDDKIFPPSNQLTTFPNALQIPGAHWAPETFAQLLSGVNQ